MKQTISNHLRKMAESFFSFLPPGDSKSQISHSIRLLEQLEKEITYAEKQNKELEKPQANKLFRIGQELFNKVKSLIGKPVGKKFEEFLPMVTEIKEDMESILDKDIPPDKASLIKEIYEIIKNFPANVREHFQKVEPALARSASKRKKL